VAENRQRWLSVAEDFRGTDLIGVPTLIAAAAQGKMCFRVEDNKRSVLVASIMKVKINHQHSSRECVMGRRT